MLDQQTLAFYQSWVRGITQKGLRKKIDCTIKKKREIFNTGHCRYMLSSRVHCPITMMAHFCHFLISKWLAENTRTNIWDNGTVLRHQFFGRRTKNKRECYKNKRTGDDSKK